MPNRKQDVVEVVEPDFGLLVEGDYSELFLAYSR